SCVLIYGAIESPLAQPKNLFNGHLISAIIGVTCYKILGEYVWIAGPLPVSLSIIGMQMAKSLHPPGGATALNAVTRRSSITKLLVSMLGLRYQEPFRYQLSECKWQYHYIHLVVQLP